MTETRQLLIVAHTPSPNTERMAQAVLKGAHNEDIENVAARHVPPLEAGPDDVMGADAIILGTTENLGYMSGALKDFFDRIYYPCLEQTQALPFASFIRAGKDGTGTIKAIDSITTGLRWRAVQEPLLCQGEFDEAFIEQCEELGLYVAAGLDAGMF